MWVLGREASHEMHTSQVLNPAALTQRYDARTTRSSPATRITSAGAERARLETDTPVPSACRRQIAPVRAR